MIFINWIRTKSLKKAGICGCVIGLINIFVHVMIIVSIIPYTWVNGGKTASLTEAINISFSSIVMTVVNIFIVLIASKIIFIKFNTFWGIVLSAFLIVTLPMSFIGIVQQFLGTVFEKCVMSVVTIIGFCVDTRIAFERRW